MARSAARVRTKVSYREPSPEEDDNEDESYGSNESPRRQSTRPARRARVSLKEPSSDEEESVSSSHSEDDEPLAELKPVKRKRKPPPVAKRTRAATEKRSEAISRRPRSGRPIGGRPSKRPKKESKQRLPHIPTDGICPLWETLPEEVLISIFQFAKDMSDTEAKGSSWLVSAARTCKAYTKPALSALYFSPALSASSRVEMFFNHMMKPVERMLMDYHSKVFHLSLNTRILGNTFDLLALIQQLPRIQSLDLWTDKDYKLRGLAQVANEKYWQPPSNLIEELGKTGVPLRSWRWNMKMMPISSDVEDRWDALLSTHTERPLNNIRSLTLTNFDYAQKEGDFFLDTTLHTLNMAHSCKALEYLPELDPEIPLVEALAAKDPLSTAIKSLPRLSHLSFEYCNIVQGPWLLRLPPSLTSLEIHGSSYLTSWHLERYLQSSGRALRRLILNHNPTLQLNFLSILKSDCPKLRELSMNLIYTNPNRADETIQPYFDEMLNKHHVPTWPTSIQKLQILHLRQWDSDAAVVFFTSILEADLPSLRHLTLSASIDIDWRERTTFRDKWVGAFDRVFLRKPDPPPAHLVSGKAYREWQQTKQRPAASHSTSERPRRVTQDAPAASLRNMVLSALGNKSEIVPMCDVVDIRIDNSRPRENEFRESDFLDSEASGDSDFES